MKKVVFSKDSLVVSEEKDSMGVSFTIDVTGDLPADLGEKICGIVKNTVEKSGLVNCVERRGDFPFATLETFYKNIEKVVDVKNSPLSFVVRLGLHELSEETRQPQFGPNKLSARVVNGKTAYGPTLSAEISDATVKAFKKSFKEFANAAFRS